MTLSYAEQKVRKLARLPGNCVCPNCGTQKKFGYSNICIRFGTFVCNNCKSSHQAISHRCKSLTMSSWSDQEVQELEQKGNDHARRTWLKSAPPVGSNGRPREGDDVNIFKRFVVDAYEHKRFYGADDGPQSGPTPPSHSAPRVAVAVPMPQSSFVAPRKPVAPPVRAPVPAPPVADLLDFFSPAPDPQPAASGNSNFANFDAFAPSPATATPAPAADMFQADFGNLKTPAPTPAADMFQADFGNLNTSAPAPAADMFQADFGDLKTPALAPAASSSSFSFLSAPPATTAAAPVMAPAPAPHTSSFGFMNNASPAPAAASNVFADFAGISTPAAPATPATPTGGAKKTVMANMGLNQKANTIGRMENLPSPRSQKGFNNNPNLRYTGMHQQQPNITHQQQPNMMKQSNMMGMTGGMNNNHNNMNAQMMMQQQMMQMNLGGGGGGMPVNNNSMMGGMPMNNNAMMGGGMPSNTNNMMGSMPMNNNNNNMMGGIPMNQMGGMNQMPGGMNMMNSNNMPGGMGDPNMKRN